MAIFSLLGRYFTSLFPFLFVLTCLSLSVSLRVRFKSGTRQSSRAFESSPRLPRKRTLGPDITAEWEPSRGNITPPSSSPGIETRHEEIERNKTKRKGKFGVSYSIFLLTLVALVIERSCITICAIRTTSPLSLALTNRRCVACDGLPMAPDSQAAETTTKSTYVMTFFYHALSLFFFLKFFFSFFSFQIWNPARPRIAELHLTEHQAAVKALAWSPHSRGTIVTGGGTADRSLRVWNVVSGNGSSQIAIDTGSQVKERERVDELNHISHSRGFYYRFVMLYGVRTQTRLPQRTATRRITSRCGLIRSRLLSIMRHHHRAVRD